MLDRCIRRASQAHEGQSRKRREQLRSQSKSLSGVLGRAKPTKGPVQATADLEGQPNGGKDMAGHASGEVVAGLVSVFGSTAWVEDRNTVSQALVELAPW